MRKKEEAKRVALARNKISRRSFLKAATALCTVSALAGCSKDDSDTYYSGGSSEREPLIEESVVPVVCRPNCGSACYQNAHIRNGRIVKFSRRALPDRRYERTCLRGLSQMQRIYSPTRLSKPLIRDESSPRGKPIWRAVDWEEAIEYIRAKLAKIHDEHGKKAVGFMPSSGNYGVIQKGFWQRFIYSVAETIIHPRMDWSMSIGYSKVLGRVTTWPFTTANEPADYVNTKTFILWGCNLVESQAMNWHFVADAVDQGAKIITIDVATSVTAARSHHFVNIQPGMDTLMALSMLHEIIINHGDSSQSGCWVNYEFMAKNTVAQFLVNTVTGKFVRYKDISDPEKTDIEINSDFLPDPEAFIGFIEGVGYVATEPDRQLADKPKFRNEMGPVFEFSTPHYLNGYEVKPAFQLLKEHVADFSPETTQAQTGVEPAVVREVARAYCEDTPSSIFTGFAQDHYTNGHHFYHAVGTLAAVTGNIGKKGSSVGMFIILTNIDTNVVNLPPDLTRINVIPYGAFMDVFDTEQPITLRNGSTYGGPNELFKGAESPVRALFIAYSNPLNTYTNPKGFIDRVLTKRNADGSYKMELVVLTDYELVDMAEYADVVLPLSHLFEQEDIIPNGSHPYTFYQTQAIKPYGESKSDGEIGRMLYEAIVNKYRFPSFDEGAAMFYNDTNIGGWQKKLTGQDPVPGTFRYEDLKRNGIVRSLPGSISEPYIFPMHRNKSTTGSIDDMVFGTQDHTSCGSRRIEFYTDTLISDSGGNYGQASGMEVFADIDLTEEEWALERLPSWEPCTEPPTPEYPFQLISERPRWRIHSQWYNTEWLREFDPYPVVKISQYDADNNIPGGPVRTGDLVRVENERGHCISRAVITIGLREGVINIPRGWHLAQYREHYGEDAGTGQFLTSSATHKVTANQNFYDAHVKVTKIANSDQE